MMCVFFLILLYLASLDCSSSALLFFSEQECLCGVDGLFRVSAVWLVKSIHFSGENLLHVGLSFVFLPFVVL